MSNLRLLSATFDISYSATTSSSFDSVIFNHVSGTSSLIFNLLLLFQELGCGGGGVVFLFVQSLGTSFI